MAAREAQSTVETRGQQGCVHVSDDSLERPREPDLHVQLPPRHFLSVVSKAPQFVVNWPSLTLWQCPHPSGGFTIRKPEAQEHLWPNHPSFCSSWRCYLLNLAQPHPLLSCPSPSLCLWVPPTALYPATVTQSCSLIPYLLQGYSPDALLLKTL